MTRSNTSTLELYRGQTRTCDDDPDDDPDFVHIFESDACKEYNVLLRFHLPIVFYLKSELELEIICKDETALSYGMTGSFSKQRKT